MKLTKKAINFRDKGKTRRSLSVRVKHHRGKVLLESEYLSTEVSAEQEQMPAMANAQELKPEQLGESSEADTNPRVNAGVLGGVKDALQVRSSGERRIGKKLAENVVLPDNPEVSSRLTNLSLRHAGMRPEWFDFEPLALSGRCRQCRKLFWDIMTDHAVHQKRMMAIVAEEGMGKTAFLAQLHSMLEHTQGDILTLAPSEPSDQPFQALRNILEQRFYISGEAPYECVERYVKGAVSAILSAESAQAVSHGILSLWRMSEESGDAPVCEQACDAETENEAETSFLGDIEAAFEKTVSVSDEKSEDDALIKESIETSPAGDDVSSQEADAGAEAASECGDASSDVAEIVEMEELSLPPAIGTEVSEPEYVENPANIEPTMILPQFQNKPVSQIVDGNEGSHGNVVLDEARVEAISAEICEPLLRLFDADLRHNPIVIVLDNVECFDEASLDALGALYSSLPDDVRLTVLLTTKNRAMVPSGLQACNMDYVELHALSDIDLAHLTQHLLKKLSETRERLIVPKELCSLIAQRSYGSPKRAIELTLRHFSPDKMIHWSEAIEQLRQEAIPRSLGMKLARRFKDCRETERTVLQLASHLNAPFTVSTMECMLATWPEFEIPEGMSCSAVLKNLREEGFLERAEESFGTNTPTYVFKHECERLMIFSTVGDSMRHHVYRSAAQWYALNNSNGVYDELIGDLWRHYEFYHEACQYYERAAYRALSKSRLIVAWPLFRKLLKTLPEGNISARIQHSLVGAQVAFRIGRVDDAFRMCRCACHQATLISAYTQAALANVQMAMMLVEMGSVRHVLRYTARANILLNREGDSKTRCFLYQVYARRSLYLLHGDEACTWITKARQCVAGDVLTPSERLQLDWIEAEIEGEFGNPMVSVEKLKTVISNAEICGDNEMMAKAYRSLGHIYDSMDNLSGALDAWNVSLGMVQEMNDVIMHANLLADIADGALLLEARRTARAATEQCLGLAQQTHQKSLIARCLANTAYLQYAEGHPERAIRTIRKAHKSALKLKNVYLWTKTLLLLALFNSDFNNPVGNPVRANQIYRRLLMVYDRHDMVLQKARFLPIYSQFLLQTNQKMAALNAWKMVRMIYQQLGIEKACTKAQTFIDKLMKESGG